MLRIDGLREADPEAALCAYLAADPRDVLHDDARMRWIFVQLRPIPREEALPLLERAADEADEPHARQAMQCAGIVHWYRGAVEEAERWWRRALVASRGAGDDVRVQAHNNLALCLAHRGEHFEALVLFGVAARLAQSLGNPVSHVFACLRRAQMLAQLGDGRAAAAELERGERLWHALEPGRDRDFVESVVYASRARVSLTLGDWATLRASQERRLELLGELPEQQHATLANAHALRLRATFELEPERGPEVLAELERLPERLHLAEQWEREWRCDVARIRMGVALHAGATRAELEPLARECLDTAESCQRGSSLVRELVELGRRLGPLGLDELARRAFDVAATHVLRQLTGASALRRDLPELADATEDDWALLAAHQRRLQREQGEILRTIAELWRPGHPAFELLVVDDLLCLCAWCRQVRTREGEWIPVADFVPESTDVEVTHALCEACRPRLFD
ncbi:MAG: hypothetical protein H6828_06950 [Planctomycetes bacterium]|nr:hypothetical protein [Planctomycetota bacterium]